MNAFHAAITSTLSLLSAVSAAAQSAQLPLSFVENLGQAVEDACFTARLPEAEAAFTPTEVRYRFGKERVSARFPGARADVEIHGEAVQSQRTNFYFGNDPAHWRTGVRNFGAVRYDGLYPGIDLRFASGDAGQLKYEFVVAPDAEWRRIEVDYDGVEQIRVDDEGALRIDTAFGELVEAPPYSYQRIDGSEVEVDVRYAVKSSSSFGFEIHGAWDPGVELVIDPTLLYSTYLGGFSFDQMGDVVVDPAGSAHVIGATLSSDFPATGSPIPGANYSVFVTKLTPDGSALDYSVFLGGTSNQVGYGIALDAAGNAYIGGSTTSADFPTTTGAYDTTFNSINAWDNDGFVAKLDPAGALVYSSFVGGSSADVVFRVDVDEFGIPYALGESASTDFPTTTGAYDETFNGGKDVTLSSFDMAGGGSTDLTYSTYLGGVSYDEARGLDTAPTPVYGYSVAYIGGSTGSTDFPMTHGAAGGGFDAFAAVLTPFGAGAADLQWSRRVGGVGHDYGLGIAVGQSYDAFLVGAAKSSGFPTTTGAVQPSYGGGGEDGFAMRITSDGSSVVYNTFLGGSLDDRAVDVVALQNGNAIAFGYSQSPDYPMTTGAFDASHNGARDFVATTLNTSGTTLAYSTFFGGSSNDVGYAFDRNVNGDWYMAGTTQSLDYPVTTSAYDTTFNGAPIDVVVSRFAWPPVIDFGPGTVTSAGFTPSLTIGGTPTIGGGIDVIASDALPHDVVFMAVGTRSATPLPLDAFGGVPGSRLLVDVFTSVPLPTDRFGHAAMPLTVPYDLALIGQRFAMQLLQADLALAGIYSLPIVHSPGVEFEVSP